MIPKSWRIFRTAMARGFSGLNLELIKGHVFAAWVIFQPNPTQRALRPTRDPPGFHEIPRWLAGDIALSHRSRLRDTSEIEPLFGL